jgi:hypothetical protein
MSMRQCSCGCCVHGSGINVHQKNCIEISMERTADSTVVIQLLCVTTASLFSSSISSLIEVIRRLRFLSALLLSSTSVLTNSLVPASKESGGHSAYSLTSVIWLRTPVTLELTYSRTLNTSESTYSRTSVTWLRIFLPMEVSWVSTCSLSSEILEVTSHLTPDTWESM